MAKQCAPWYPTIFPDCCDGCEDREAPRCIQFCPNDVFEIRNGKAIVARPYNCVYGCTACEPVCPRKAITFPQRRTVTAVTSTVKDKGLLHKVKCKKCGKIFGQIGILTCALTAKENKMPRIFFFFYTKLSKCLSP